MSALDKVVNLFKKPHTCVGEDRDNPDSWDDPMIYDQPYYTEPDEVEPTTIRIDNTTWRGDKL